MTLGVNRPFVHDRYHRRDENDVRDSQLAAQLSPGHAASLERLLAGRSLDVQTRSWRSGPMARFATELIAARARDGVVEEVVQGRDGEVRCVLRDRRDRRQELLLRFASESSGVIANMSIRPVLAAGTTVRAARPDDVAAMRRLESSAPVVRDDGTEVVIDHNGKQFDHAAVATDHRYLAAFRGDQMVAVQGVVLTSAPIGGVPHRLALNHYSRTDPENRQGGNVFHLILTLYHDIFPQIDQFLSIVDVRNRAGLRLSLGEPWPTRVRRLFLPVAALAQRASPAPSHRPFDAGHAAALLNATHAGMNLWVPRTRTFLDERRRRAPTVYDSSAWRMTDHAALALWPSGERRTYRTDTGETARTLGLALDYGFSGEQGREDLTNLLSQAAKELLGQGISHIALFVSDNHPPTAWLAALADAADTYAVCAPVLESPAPPTGPIYIDHILF
jgi:hypothetical protein